MAELDGAVLMPREVEIPDASAAGEGEANAGATAGETTPGASAPGTADP